MYYAYQDAYSEARRELVREVDESYLEAVELYELDDPDFVPVPTEIYENLYRNEPEDFDRDGREDGTVRVYAQTDDINLACVMDGRLPEAEDEIAIDRMHADNVGVGVGDTITVGGQSFKIAGLIAYVNYSTLHEKNTDFMFDALKFDVAMVTEAGFSRLGGDIHYNYAWKYLDEPSDDVGEKALSDSLMKAVLTQSVVYERGISDFVPRYSDSAVNFATDDMGSDKAMGGVILDILILIIAFIFAVTVSRTIAREARTIGTLLASGYTRRELTVHYLSIPIIVTLLSAVAGNALGYTVFKNIVVSMYYNSYSLPAYRTVWDTDAFIRTTLIPAAIMLAVNAVVITRALRLSPLKFLRGELKNGGSKKTPRLPRLKFMSRFRLRIILQNIPGYLIMFSGIYFISVLLAMAVGMPDTLDRYQEHASEMMFSRYQYVLKTCEDEDGNRLAAGNDAEDLCLKSLEIRSNRLNEEISVYGVLGSSRYIKADGLDGLEGNEVFISRSLSEKYGFEVGDAIVLDEKYENKSYEFEVAGIYGSSLTLALFMPDDNFRQIFDFADGEFNCFISDNELAGLDEKYVAAVITEKDITKMCDQLEHSMGSYMKYFCVLCILLSAVLLYLITKTIIEKNEKSISMVKNLGYDNRETARLHMLSSAAVAVASDAVCVFLGAFTMSKLWANMMADYTGWFSFEFEPLGYIKIFLFILAGYLIVSVFDYRRICRIPLSSALKSAE